MKELYSLFVPIKLIKVTSEIISYLFKSIIKYWFLFCPLLIILTFIICKYLQTLFFKHYFLIIGFGLFVCAIPGFILILKRHLTIKKYKVSENSILISDCLLIKQNTYIDLDIESDSIRLKLIEQIKNIRETYYPFKIPFLEIEIIHHSKLFYLLKDFNSIKKTYYKEVENNKSIALLLIFKNELNQKIEFDIIPRQDFHFKPLNDVINTFSNLNISNEGFNTNYIIEVAKIFISMIAYGSLKLFDIETQHKIIDDNQKIMISAIDILINKIKPEPIAEILHFKKNYKCEFERTKGLIFQEQREFYGALHHVFNATEVNPFFPCDTYDEFKEQYTLKYILRFPSIILALKNSELLTEELKFYSTNLNAETMFNKIFERIKYPQTPFYSEIISQISKEANSPEIDKLIKNKLNSDFCEVPINELIKGEVLKLIPMEGKGNGTEEIYFDRIPEVINCYRKVLESDQDFIIMNIKLSVMLQKYYWEQPQTNFSKQRIDESVELMQRGFSIFRKYNLIN